MGWDFYCDKRFTKDVIVAEKITGRDLTCDGVAPKVLAHSLRGNNLWRVIEKPDGERFIALDLLRSGGKDSGWGYKGLCETMGPCEVNCPLYMLDLVPEPKDSEFAAGWRDRVRAHHANKRTKRTWKEGQRINLFGRQYVLRQPRTTLKGRKNGWIADGADGLRYRISPQNMAKAEEVL